MPNHKFKIGQQVYYRPNRGAGEHTDDAYHVIKRQWAVAGTNRYRIRSLTGEEWVAREYELRVVGTFQQKHAGSKAKRAPVSRSALR